MTKLRVGKTIALISLLLFYSAVSGIAGTTVTLVGELIDDYQFITDDGLVFEIGDTEKGAELLGNITSQRVKITGTLEKTDETMVIYVVRYEILSPGQGE